MPKQRISREKIEQLRDRIYRRNYILQVKTMDQALDFINEVGFCFAFSAKNSELPCLWHAACGERSPVMPKHTHHDPYISLVWRAKDELPAKQSVYYGKVIKKRPAFISLAYFPYFYAQFGSRQNTDAYLVDFMRGELSSPARKIMDALQENSPLITRDLKLASGMSRPDQRYIFDQAMAELQMKMYILKIAEFYEPFTFLWELVPNRFPAEIAQAQKISPETARLKILKKYFHNVLIGTALQIQRLFGWSKPVVDGLLAQLLDQKFITDTNEIEGERGKWFGLPTLNF